MRGKLVAAILGMALGIAAPAGAAPIGSDQARELLFAPSGMVFYPVEPKGLDAAAGAQIAALQAGMAAQMATFEQGGYGYYGAMAVPKGQPLGPESLTVIAGLHSPAAAQRSVLAQCKASHKAECTVVGLMLPKGYQSREFTLSSAATKGVLDAFKAGSGPQYLAYSPATAGFAVVKGTGADALAVTTCNEATAGRNDCVLAIADE